MCLCAGICLGVVPKPSAIAARSCVASAPLQDDASIEKAIKEKFASMHALKGLNIEVTVEKGIATLKGAAPRIDVKVAAGKRLKILPAESRK